MLLIMCLSLTEGHKCRHVVLWGERERERERDGRLFKSLTLATYLKLVMCTFWWMLVSQACGHIRCVRCLNA